MSAPSTTRPGKSISHSPLRLILAALIFAVLLYGFWTEVHTIRIAEVLGSHVPSAFACFALLLAPLWFFGFIDFSRFPGSQSAVIPTEAAQPRSGGTRTTAVIPTGAKRSGGTRISLLRVLLPALLGIPYLVFSLPRHEFHWIYAVELFVIPVAAATVLEFSDLPHRFTWQDFVVLLSLALILETHVLGGAWPYPGLGGLPKLYLADVALYVYLVNRRLPGIGYSFVPTDTGSTQYPARQAKAWRFLTPFAIGLREWLFFAPIGIGLGLALHFIRFIPRVHHAFDIIAALLVTFLLTAVPEELFFRGILQNLLEPIMGRTRSLFLASALFGLSHFHKGAMFNWRYVILAFIAGLFYGRAWRSRRQLLASSTTHTLVDVVWSLWFR